MSLFMKSYIKESEKLKFGEDICRQIIGTIELIKNKITHTKDRHHNLKNGQEAFMKHPTLFSDQGNAK